MPLCGYWLQYVGVVPFVPSRLIGTTEGTLMIEAHGLTKRYGATLAVNDLSFEVRPAG